jgi:hypothetical protein
MPDITSLLLPDLVSEVPVEIESIHPSRMRNFNNTATFTEADPSFLPRPVDIARARRQLERAQNPPIKPKKMNLQERQLKRKAKKERMENPKPIPVARPVKITREPIEDPLQHLLDGLTGEGQLLGVLIKNVQADVRAGGGKLKVNQQLLGRLGLRKEEVDENGNGGRIVVEVLKTGRTMASEQDNSDDDNESD